MRMFIRHQLKKHTELKLPPHCFSIYTIDWVTEVAICDTISKLLSHLCKSICLFVPSSFCCCFDTLLFTDSADGLESAALFLPLPAPPPVGAATPSFSATAGAAAADLGGRPRRLTGDASVSASGVAFWLASSWEWQDSLVKTTLTLQCVQIQLASGWAYLLDLVIFDDRVLVVFLRSTLWWLSGSIAVTTRNGQQSLGWRKHYFLLVLVHVCIPVLVDGWRAQRGRVGAGVTGCIWGCGGLGEDPPPWHCQRLVHSCQHWCWFRLQKETWGLEGVDIKLLITLCVKIIIE